MHVAHNVKLRSLHSVTTKLQDRQDMQHTWVTLQGFGVKNGGIETTCEIQTSTVKWQIQKVRTESTGLHLYGQLRPGFVCTRPRDHKYTCGGQINFVLPDDSAETTRSALSLYSTKVRTQMKFRLPLSPAQRANGQHNGRSDKVHAGYKTSHCTLWATNIP
jgi:hypothetical protein